MLTLHMQQSGGDCEKRWEMGILEVPGSGTYRKIGHVSCTGHIHRGAVTLRDIDYWSDLMEAARARLLAVQVIRAQFSRFRGYRFPHFGILRAYIRNMMMMMEPCRKARETLKNDLFIRTTLRWFLGQ